MSSNRLKYEIFDSCWFFSFFSFTAKSQESINIWIFNEQKVISISPEMDVTNLILISVQKGEYHSFTYSSKNRKKWETLLKSNSFDWISFDREQHAFLPITFCPYSLIKKNNKRIAFIEWRLPSKKELEIQKRDVFLGLNNTLDFLRLNNVDYFVLMVGGTSTEDLEPYIISLAQKSIIKNVVVIPQIGDFEKTLPTVVGLSECSTNIERLCIE